MNSETAAMAEAPVLDIDPYSIDVLRDPYAFHEQLREAGPVAFIKPHGEAEALLGASPAHQVDHAHGPRHVPPHQPDAHAGQAAAAHRAALNRHGPRTHFPTPPPGA